MTTYENVMLNWDGNGDYAQTVVPLPEVEEQNRERAHLVRENARLLAYVQALEEVCDSDQLARAQSALANVVMSDGADGS